MNFGHDSIDQQASESIKHLNQKRCHCLYTIIIGLIDYC